MSNPSVARFTAALAAAALVACSAERGTAPSEHAPDVNAMAFAADGSDWSEPVHLPAPINSPYHELGGAQLSPDGLALYFASDRPGGFGAIDIWIARRDCQDCPWGAPVNAGPTLNSSTGDGSVVFTPDGLTMFFSGGARPGGAGDNDIYVTHRTDPNDDFSWETPVNVGPGVNTPAHESGPAYVPALNGSGANFYFGRDPGYFQTRVTRDGEVVAPVTPFVLGDPSANVNEVTVRADGRELIFFSNRSGGMGGADLWVATRGNLHEPWSEPTPLPLSTRYADLSPSLSWDGRTLFFSAAAAARPSLGFQDIWMSTRRPGGQ